MNQSSLSMDFYNNWQDVSFIFQYSTNEVRNEILNSNLTELEKVKLLNLLCNSREIFNLLDMLSVQYAVYLSLLANIKSYFKVRFDGEIKDESFDDFNFILMTKMVTFEQLSSFSSISLSEEKSNEVFFNYCSRYSFNELSILINRLNGETLNYFCSKKPKLVLDLNSKRGLYGRNLYRYYVHLLKNHSFLGFFSNLDIPFVRNIFKYHREDVISNILMWGNSTQSNLIIELADNDEIEIALIIYGYLSSEARFEADKSGFAIYSQGCNFNGLTIYQLAANLRACKTDRQLLTVISMLNKEKIIDLIIKECADVKSEFILLSTFSTLEIIKVCEVNIQFTKAVLSVFSNNSVILNQFSNYEWFWLAMNQSYGYSITRVLSKINFDTVLTHINRFQGYEIQGIFEYFFNEDKQKAFAIFNNVTCSKLDIILHNKLYLPEFISRYGVDFIINQGTDERSRRLLLEHLPLPYALLVINAYNLTSASPEFQYLHLGRSKALKRRISAQVA